MRYIELDYKKREIEVTILLFLFLEQYVFLYLNIVKSRIGEWKAQSIRTVRVLGIKIGCNEAK